MGCGAICACLTVSFRCASILMVQPAQKISFDVTGEAGRWAWHCHLLYHMEAGMFREVAVV
ncbi:multicopper oxidase domain-containing protein [Psychrobacter sp. WY6]|uniref:multicopper oxidase domain-containing protein n=1 Tax=Psychrobacter sp. WY6 TaxID=2708350 RepID=UPI0032E7F65A